MFLVYLNTAGEPAQIPKIHELADGESIEVQTMDSCPTLIVGQVEDQILISAARTRGAGGIGLLRSGERRLTSNILFHAASTLEEAQTAAICMNSDAYRMRVNMEILRKHLPETDETSLRLAALSLAVNWRKKL